jgi:hypothetical protein
MFKPFELLSTAITALNQAGLLLGSGFLGGLGALLVGNRLYWRLRATSVSGTLVGLRSSGGKTYFLVYRYKLAATRAKVEATSDTGTRSVSGMHTGRAARLLVFPEHPDKVTDADSYIAEIIGGILFAACSVVAYIAVTAWPVTPLTWLMLAGIAVHLVDKLRRSVPIAGRSPAGSILSKPPPENIHAAPLRSVEEIRAQQQRERQLTQRKTGRIVTPILVLVGIGVLALGVYLARTVTRLESAGQRTHGTVVGLELESTVRSSSYYPVVRFATPEGATVQFRDSAGSNPPAYHEGDVVVVLYLRGSPEQSAIIDKGWWNWLPPVALCVFGAILTSVALRVRLGSLPVPRNSVLK